MRRHIKGFLCLCLCCMLLTSVFTPFVLAESVNEPGDIIYFEDFEKGVLPFDTVYRTAEITSSTAYSGKASARTRPMPGSGHGVAGFALPQLSNNGKYIVRMKLQANQAGSYATAKLQYKTGGAYKWAQSSRAFTIGDVWGEASFLIPVSEGGEATLTEPMLILDLVGGDIYLDDVEVLKVNDFQLEQYNAEFKEKNTPVAQKLPEEIENAPVWQEVYVDAHAQGGGDGSAGRPFQTIEAAKQYVRKISGDMQGDIIVWIHEGFYFQEETLRFGSQDSGSNGYHIYYKAKPGASVTVSGGRVITGWKETDKKGVWEAPCPVRDMRNLYVNNERAVRAASEDYVTPISWWDDDGDSTSDKDGFVIPKGIITDPQDVYDMELYNNLSFLSRFEKVQKVFPQGDHMVLALQQPHFNVSVDVVGASIRWDLGHDFRLENSRQFLDQPGEWYRDSRTDTLYYIPKPGQDMNSIEVVAPDTEKIIEVKGDRIDNRVSNITFSGLTIAYGGYKRTTQEGFAGYQATQILSKEKTGAITISQITGNISLQNAYNIRFENNVIKHMDANGFDLLEGVQNIRINGNILYDFSAAAISIGHSFHEFVTDPRMIPINNSITNNVIASTGIEYNCVPGVNALYVNGLQLLHNEILHSYYSAVSVGWGWDSKKDSVTCQNNHISYNNIYDYSLVCKDTGGIYTLGQQPGTQISFNHLYSPMRDAQAIYPDMGSAYMHIHNNVLDQEQTNYTSWVFLWMDNIYDITLTDNFVTNADRPDFALNTVEKGTTYVVNGNWPERAREIVGQAGLKPEYRRLRSSLPGYEGNEQIKRINIQTLEQGGDNPAAVQTGDTLTLTVLAEMQNGQLTDDIECEYFVSDSSVAVVNGNRVTAVGPGAAVITAKHGDFRGVLYIVVDDEAQSIEIIVPKTGMAPGESVPVKYSLNTKYWKYNISQQPMEFSSLTDDMAEVSDRGIVTAKHRGNARIRLFTSYMGKPFSGVAEFNISGQSLTGVGLSDYIVPKGTTGINAVGILSDGSQVSLDGSNVSVHAKKIERQTAPVPESYGKEMAYLRQNAIIGEASPLDGLTERDFVGYLAKTIARAENEIGSDASDQALTRERMAEFASNALIRVFGENQVGNTVLPNISDVDQITPRLIPYVSNAVEYEVFNAQNPGTAFRPKDAATLEEAAKVIFRMIHPLETYAENYVAVSPVKLFNTFLDYTLHFITNRDTAQSQMATPFSGSSEASASQILKELCETPGIYELNISGQHNGFKSFAKKRLFVYEPDYPRDLMLRNFGPQDGIAAEKDGKILLASSSDDTWGRSDELTFACREADVREDFEISATIESFENTQYYAGAGIMIRADEDSNSANVNYRMRPNGELILTWRAVKGGESDYRMVKQLPFPAEIKLVKRADTITGYYRGDGGSWHQGESIDIKGWNPTAYAGLMLYAKTGFSGIVGSAEFSNLYMGSPRSMQAQALPADSKQEGTPAAPSEDHTLFQLAEQISMFNLIPDNGFENSSLQWKGSGIDMHINGTEAYRGYKSLQLMPGTSDGSIAMQIGAISKKSRYFVSFYAKMQDGDVKAFMRLKVADRDFDIAPTLSSAKTADGDWRRYAAVFEIDETPETGNAEIVLQPVSNGRVLIDEIEMTQY